MNAKRILALALSALMLFALIPAAVFAEEAPAKKQAEPEKLPEPEPEKLEDPETRGFIDQLNANGTFLSYVNGNPGWLIKEGTNSDTGSTYYYAESNNAGQHATDADLTISQFYMYSGETITFQYWFESETNYDKFILLDNGSEVFSGSGKSGGGSSPAWVNYTYTCSTSGNHTFVFRYHKDSTGNTGADCARVYGVTYSKHKLWYERRAVLNEGMSGNFVGYTNSSSYPFYVASNGNSGHELYLYNGNKNTSNSTSYFEVRAWVEQAPIDLKFDYAYSCEQNYDFFNFYVNNSRVFHYSGTDDYNWKTYTYTITARGYYTFKFEYTKDGSNDGGSDQVCVDNIRFTSEAADQRANSYNMDGNLNSASSDAWLTFNSPTGTSSFVGANSSDGSGYYVISNNRYANAPSNGNSESYIETIVNMAQGETLSFQYYVSSEKNYDKLIFYANGVEKMTASGWDNSSWTTYTFTAPSTGSYLFKWVYHKDGSNSYGLDYAAIAYVRYTGSHSYGSSATGWGYHNAFTLEQALIDTGTNGGTYALDSSSVVGNDYFLPYNDGTGNCIISRNKYYESSSSFAQIWCYDMVPGDTIYFEYKVPAETYDKLYINIDGEGSNDANLTASGSTSDTWHQYTSWTCTTPGTVTIDFEFRKDSSVNSGDDCAMIRNFAIVKAPDPGLDNAMRKSGQEMTFTSGGTYHWQAGYHGTTLCGVPNNTGNLSGGGTATATVSTTVYMNMGDQFRFEYICDLNNSSYSDWTPSFTVTVLSPNASTLLNLNNTANVTSWTAKSYSAFTSGLYTFTWTYTRPNQGWEFAPGDEVCVRNCEIVAGSTSRPSVNAALNVDDGNLTFTATNFAGDYWFEDDIATSMTFNQPNTNATLTTTVHMNAGDRLRFQYYVSCEEECDYLVFRVNNSTVFQESGLVDWEWYDWTAPSSGNYQFEWTYHKDGSVSRGLDCAKLDFVELISAGSTGPGNGDVDGNGSVNVTDAVLALRHAMGLITLTGEQLARGDVDGNGTVNVTDAVTIMRKAMGIIP